MSLEILYPIVELKIVCILNPQQQRCQGIHQNFMELAKDHAASKLRHCSCWSGCSQASIKGFRVL
jgi:hypothetical protein